QAEDGIRDRTVTGVQTCALPIYGFDVIHAHNPPDTFVFIAMLYKLFGKRFVFDHHDLSAEMYQARLSGRGNPMVYRVLVWLEKRSEERRVGKEGGWRWGSGGVRK